MIVAVVIFAGCGSDAGFPAVNLDVSRYDNRSMNPQESGNGFFFAEDRLTLTYDEGKYLREFPDAVNYLNTGIFVSDAVTSVSVYDADKISAEVYTSKDRGESWTRYEIDLSAHALIGGYIESVIPSEQFIGFTSSDDGWLIAAKDKGMGQGGFVLFRTKNGGVSWEKVENGLSGSHPFTVTGAGFADAEHGFVCFTNAVSAADVYETFDGGATWSQCDLLSCLPEEYSDIETLTASSPTFDGKNGILPLSYFDGGETIRLHLTSTDGGVTWKYTE